jgi:hypothetical protein
MKKAKIMLAAVIALSTVGGALAFKVKKSQLKLCIEETLNSGICPNLIYVNYNPFAQQRSYYSWPDITQCDNNTLCTSSERVVPE